MNELLKKYDKMLSGKKLLDGTISIKRKSPFSAFREYDIISFTNQRVGSGKWIYNRIQQMDSQRVDFGFNDNSKPKQKQDGRVTRDIINTLFEDKILI